MIDTPRTDAAEKHAYEFKDEYTPVCESKFARQLERELNAANDRIKQLEDRINRASIAFFEDGSDARVARWMMDILEEERRKP